MVGLYPPQMSMLKKPLKQKSDVKRIIQRGRETARQLDRETKRQIDGAAFRERDR